LRRPTVAQFNEAIIRRLGDKAYAAPVALIGPHLFLYVPENCYCGRCGGGLLHQIHASESLGAAA
jgi:hypothetical protein